MQTKDCVSRVLSENEKRIQALYRLRSNLMGGFSNVVIISTPLSSDKSKRYRITYDNGQVRCNCPAAQFGKKCRHVMSDRVRAWTMATEITPVIVARADARVQRRIELRKKKAEKVDNLYRIW